MAHKSRPSHDRGCLFDKYKYKCKHQDMAFKRPCHDVCRKVKVPRKLKKLCCTRSHSKFKNKLQVKAKESRQTGLVGFDQKRRWVQYPGNYPYCAALTMPKYTKQNTNILTERRTSGDVGGYPDLQLLCCVFCRALIELGELH